MTVLGFSGATQLQGSRRESRLLSAAPLARCAASLQSPGAQIAFHHDFRRLRSREALVEALNLSDEAFQAVLDFEPPSDEARAAVESETADIPLFLRHDIPKRRKSRGHRTVWEALLLASTYKALARRLNTFLEIALQGYPHDAVFGFRSGRNIRDNAAVHVGRLRLLSVDIDNFFGSISVDRIAALFVAAGMASEVAALLARFVTIAGTLPAGLATSPVLSNAIALDLDRDLEALAARHGAVYSRYADDISLSADGDLPPLEAVARVLARHGFRLAEGKTRRSKRGQAHFVTGLSISDPEGPHVPKAIKRRLRQQLYYADRYGLAASLERRGIKGVRQLRAAVNSLDGLVKFVAHQEPKRRPHLRDTWREIVRASPLKPSFEPKSQARTPFDFFIDEAELTWNGERLLALAISVSQHQAAINAATLAVLAEDLGDMYSAGRAEVLTRKGLHYFDAHEDLRLAYVTRLASLPFEGYVAIALLGGAETYEATYLRLLGALMPRRLMAAESRKARIFCEVNDKVAQRAVIACVERAWAGLAAREDRRPQRISLAFVSKPTPGSSVPDFLLGVLGRYLRSSAPAQGQPQPRDRLMFERLRDKYRLILDLRDWTEYTRRRPIAPELGPLRRTND